MITINYNDLSISELKSINRVLGIEYIIEDGRITKVRNKEDE